MVAWLTPSERRGVAVLVAIFLAGAVWDFLQVRRAPVRSGAGTAWDSAGVAMPDPTRPARSWPGAAVPRVLDLNRATVVELDALPGIGPVLAGRIITHRDRVGGFRRIEDLLAVRGVGPRLLERNAPRLRIGGTPDGPAGPAPEPWPGMHSAPEGRPGLADSTSVHTRSSR